MTEHALPFHCKKDLEFAKISTVDGIYVVARNPVANQYHLLSPIQFKLLESLDGISSCKSISMFVRQAFPEYDVTDDDVVNVAIDLHRNGLTTSTRAGQSLQLARIERENFYRRIRNALLNPTFIRLPSLDPSPLARQFRLIGLLFYSWPMLVAWSMLICLVSVQFASRWNQLLLQWPSIEDFFGWPNLLSVWLVAATTKVIHELGHATACYRFGRRCNGIGISLLLFMPTMYCQTDDAWMLDSRWKRMIISAGGMYFEIGFAAVASLLWINSQPGLLRNLAFNVGAVSAFSTVILNANPLLKFDGYYILMDWLKVTNLQSKSSWLLQKWLGHVWGYEMVSSPDEPRSLVWMYVLYGWLATINRWTLVFRIATAAYLLLTPFKLSSIGVALGVFSTISLVVGWFISWQQIQKSKQPLVVNRFRRQRSLFCVVLLCIAVFAVPIPVPRSASCMLEPEGTVHVQATVAGTLDSIYSTSASLTAEGSPLVQLRNDELDIRLVDASNELLVEQSRLSTLKRIGEPNSIHEATEKVRELEVTLQQLHLLHEQMRVLSPVAGWLESGDREESISRLVLDDPIKKWSGRILENLNLGASVERATSIAYVLPESSSVNRAVLVVGLEDAKQFEPGMKASLRLFSAVWDAIPVEVRTVATSSSTTLPAEFSLNTNEKDNTKNRMMNNASVRVIIEFDPKFRAETFHLRGKVTYWSWKRSLASWCFENTLKFFLFG